MQRNYQTKGKTKILDFFQKNGEKALGAVEIFEALNQGEDKVNLATVYRNLDKMTAAGILMKLQDNQADRCVYQYVEGHHACNEHLHMQCIKCGKVMHLECNFMDEIATHLEEKHQFELLCTNSILYGVCSDCKALQNSEGEK